MPKRTSLQDIASALHISVSTVSAVLNGKSEERRISTTLTKKVLDFASEMNYKPNALARSLRTGSSQIIGMLVEDISDPFFASIAREIEKLVWKAGYKIFFVSTENDANYANNIIQTFIDGQVDGYIIAPPPHVESTLQQLTTMEVPVVIFDRHLPSIQTHNVLVNNKKGTYEAINYIIKKGKQHIALVTLDSNQTQMADRLNGYKQAMKEQERNNIILQLNYKRGKDDITPLLKAFIEQNSDIDAILFTTNYLTASGLKALKSLSKNIPEDIAVIGYDDNSNFSLYTPTITAVFQPTKKIANAIFDKFIALINSNKKVHPTSAYIDTELIYRESC